METVKETPNEVVNLMVDLETLSTKENAVVIEICIVEFQPCVDEIDYYLNPLDSYDRFTYYSTPEIFGQLMRGRVIDDDTVNWWKSQNAETVMPMIDTRQVVYNEPGADLATKLSELANTGKTIRLWCRGKNFDPVILESLIKSEVPDFKCPWRFSDVVDIRSWERFAETFGYRKAKRTTAHGAPEDCKKQILEVQEASKYIAELINDKSLNKE